MSLRERLDDDYEDHIEATWRSLLRKEIIAKVGKWKCASCSHQLRHHKSAVVQVQAVRHGFYMCDARGAPNDKMCHCEQLKQILAAGKHVCRSLELEVFNHNLKQVTSLSQKTSEDMGNTCQLVWEYEHGATSTKSVIEMFEDLGMGVAIAGAAVGDFGNNVLAAITEANKKLGQTIWGLPVNPALGIPPYRPGGANYEFVKTDWAKTDYLSGE